MELVGRRQCGALDSYPNNQHNRERSNRSIVRLKDFICAKKKFHLSWYCHRERLTMTAVTCLFCIIQWFFTVNRAAPAYRNTTHNFICSHVVVEYKICLMWPLSVCQKKKKETTENTHSHSLLFSIITEFLKINYWNSIELIEFDKMNKLSATIEMGSYTGRLCFSPIDHFFPSFSLKHKSWHAEMNCFFSDLNMWILQLLAIIYHFKFWMHWGNQFDYILITAKTDSLWFVWHNLALFWDQCIHGSALDSLATHWYPFGPFLSHFISQKKNK